MRPDASENSQISPSTIVRAARAAGSHPQLASVLLQGRKSANIHASSGVIRGMPVKSFRASRPSVRWDGEAEYFKRRGWKPMAINEPQLIADIGGTNTRLAIGQDGQFKYLRELRNADH